MKRRKKGLNILANLKIDRFLEVININIKKNINIINRNITNIRKDFVRYHEPYSEVLQNYRSMLVRIKLPDVPKKNLLLKVGNGKIEVRGHTFIRENDKKLLRGFYRIINLPQNALLHKAKAKYKNDVLKIKIPIAHHNK